MSSPRLLDQVRTVIRVKHFSLSTERSYVSWIRRFILFHRKRHPQEMAEPETRQFISHLAVDAKISASTQTVALSALLFLYREVLDGTHYLVACLLYGSGLRLMEAVRLRVKDIDFERNEIMVREGKGAKDRVTMLPGVARDLLQANSLRYNCALPDGRATAP